MNNKQLDKNEVLNRRMQKVAKLQHTLKAKFNSKEKKRCQALSQYFEKGSVVFDVGGHFGYLTKEFAKLYGGGCSIHSFEPTSYNYDVLQRVCGKIKNAVLNNFALSDSKGTVDINIPVKKQGKIGPGLAHFGDETNRDYITESIDTITMDEYMTENDIQNLDFIKCDVEGAELLVYKGGLNTLKKYKPVVYTEIREQFTQRLGYSAKEIFNLFFDLGYKAYICNEAGIRSNEVKTYTDEAQDYLFIPDEKSY